MSQIGPYPIESELGRGATGVIFRGVDPATGSAVAIKTIRLSGGPVERNSLAERLLREARSAAMLSHPNIATVYQAGRDDDLAYLATEYVRGSTLAQVLAATKNIAPEKSIEVLRQVAEALDYAAQNGVVHRNLKPSNILLQENGAVKVTDFGATRPASQAPAIAGMSAADAVYLAPEQIQGNSPEGRIDQYAIAVIAYELIAGSRPFEADSLTTLFFKIVYEQPAAPHAVNSRLPAALEPVFRRALSKDSSARYESCAAFIRHLERGMQGAATAARNRTKVLAATAILVLATAVAGIYALVGSPDGARASGEVQPALPQDATASPRESVAAAKPLVVDGAEQAKRLIRAVAPVYPPLAETARVEGEVVLSILVGRDGSVKNAEVRKGHPYLIPAALKAASQWIYEPALVGGAPVEVASEAVVVFKLKRE